MSLKDAFLREEIYNIAVNIGSLMIGRVDKSTVNNMISLFLGRSDTKEALNELVLYIARQVGRGEIPREVGRQLMKDISMICDIFKDDERKLKDSLSKYLIMTKWVYDSNVRGVRNLKELIGAFKEK